MVNVSKWYRPGLQYWGGWREWVWLWSFQKFLLWGCSDLMVFVRIPSDAHLFTGRGNPLNLPKSLEISECHLYNRRRPVPQTHLAISSPVRFFFGFQDNRWHHLRKRANASVSDILGINSWLKWILAHHPTGKLLILFPQVLQFLLRRPGRALAWWQWLGHKCVTLKMTQA